MGPIPRCCAGMVHKVTTRQNWHLGRRTYDEPRFWKVVDQYCESLARIQDKDHHQWVTVQPMAETVWNHGRIQWTNADQSKLSQYWLQRSPNTNDRKFLSWWLPSINYRLPPQVLEGRLWCNQTSFMANMRLSHTFYRFATMDTARVFLLERLFLSMWKVRLLLGASICIPSTMDRSGITPAWKDVSCFTFLVWRMPRAVVCGT